tara:strand:+ start:210 stop:431 length:222 start_codon:yes stop_codon:yes gene_type:complete
MDYSFLMDYFYKLAKIDYEELYTILDHKIDSVICEGALNMNDQLRDLLLLQVRLLNTTIEIEQKLKDENHEPL